MGRLGTEILRGQKKKTKKNHTHTHIKTKIVKLPFALVKMAEQNPSIETDPSRPSPKLG